ncbi:MAG: DUF1273 domain-containing protein [Clostridia bacterium]|nr:DUF1273 domain-containing protein [Clostridia bacterium]
MNFYVGNYGAFDRMCARAVRSLKKKYSFINLNLVVPYLTAEINDNKEQYYADFDCILLADIPETTPRRLGIIKCNEYMVKKSDYIICFVKYSWGVAAKTLEYAESKKHIKIINIS